MKDRTHRDARDAHDDVNRGDYRGDFGPEGHDRFASPPDHDHREHHEGHYGRRRHRDRDAQFKPSEEHGPGRWQWQRSDREGWHRSREAGGFGSEHAGWSAGAGHNPAGFGFGPEEHPRARAGDQDWQVTRPARGRGAWAGDWASEHETFQGRGPKNYRRSDERLRDEVCELLTHDRSVDAREITVEVKDGEVTLTGTVPSRDQKRRASQCAEHVPGVHDVFNQLRVVASESVEVRRR